MTADLRSHHVEFGMYPFASVAWAWDELWAAVHRRAPWLPAELTRSGDVHTCWYDPDCIVTHVCGWPFAALHRNDMHLVGAFSLDLTDAEPPAHYRSVLLSSSDRPAAERSWADTRAAANSADSLSGWHSLRAATVGPGNDWPGPVTYTSAHRDSLRALANGAADVACIDSWSLSLMTEEEPDLVDGLHRIGVGPRIPTPAITARKSLDAESVDGIRTALTDTVDDPDVVPALRALHITGFVRLEMEDYLDTLRFGPPS